MNAYILGTAALILAGPALAQVRRSYVSPLGIASGVDSRISARAYEGGAYIDSDGTPTMLGQKAARVLALRDEAFRLRAADGGTLSPRDAAHVRAKARELLGQ